MRILETEASLHKVPFQNLFSDNPQKFLPMRFPLKDNTTTCQMPPQEIKVFMCFVDYLPKLYMCVPKSKDGLL